MENEETTTSTPVDDSAATATTDDATTEQAVETTNESSETTSSETETNDESSSKESDDDIKAWAEKKGLSLDDPIALAKMVREGDKKVTEASQKASELGKSVETASTELGLDDVAQLKNEVAVMRFYQSYPDARDLDGEMSKVLDDKPYFANDLEGLYFYTKGLQADKGVVAARQAGNKEALAATAQAERAATPKASAANRTSPKEVTDEDIRNMSVSEYQEAKAAGKIPDPFRP